MMHISEPTSAASTAGDTLAHVTFDPGKRAGTLRQRGLDFLDAPKVFAGVRFTFEDERLAYPEPRYITVGLLDGRMAIVVWSPDGEIDGEECRRSISMRKANGREQARYLQRLGQG
jgi:uncharacterized DUF497 family protein